VLPLPAHRRRRRITPFVDWANGNNKKLLMHIKLEDAPRCFQCKYIATIEIFFNFIGFDHISFDGIVALV
jgi:hypothetical protein